MLRHWRFWRKVSLIRMRGFLRSSAAKRASSLRKYKQRDGGRYATADADLEQSIESRLDRALPELCRHQAHQDGRERGGAGDRSERRRGCQRRLSEPSQSAGIVEGRAFYRLDRRLTCFALS
jgi:hypothetical protein